MQLFGWLDAAEGYSETSFKNLEESVQLLKVVGQRDDLGWSEAIYSLILMQAGRYQEGIWHLREALTIGQKLNSLMPNLLSLPAIILYDLHRENYRRALTLYSAIRNHPSTGENGRWWRDVCGKEVESFTRNFPKTEIEQAQAEGKQRAKDIVLLGGEILADLSR